MKSEKANSGSFLKKAILSTASLLARILRGTIYQSRRIIIESWKAFVRFVRFVFNVYTSAETGVIYVAADIVIFLWLIRIFLIVLASLVLFYYLGFKHIFFWFIGLGLIILLILGSIHAFLNEDSGSTSEFNDEYSKTTPVIRFAIKVLIRTVIAFFSLYISAPQVRDLTAENLSYIRGMFSRNKDLATKYLNKSTQPKQDNAPLNSLRIQKSRLVPNGTMSLVRMNLYETDCGKYNLLEPKSSFLIRSRLKNRCITVKATVYIEPSPRVRDLRFHTTLIDNKGLLWKGKERTVSVPARAATYTVYSQWRLNWVSINSSQGFHAFGLVVDGRELSRKKLRFIL